MVLAERGQIHVQVYKNSAKEQVTVMVATFPGIPDMEHLTGNPGGAYFSWNKKGWTDEP